MKSDQNPKLFGSEIIDCIPQTGHCPNKCTGCFYNNGFYRPLDKPQVPTVEEVGDRIVRVNSGHDSNIDKGLVLKTTEKYEKKFYNTSIGDFDFPGPVIFTANPDEDKRITTSYAFFDKDFYNLMAVRVRVNTWNLHVCDIAINRFTEDGIPILLTFMRYPLYEQVKEIDNYEFHKHIINSYYCIKEEAFNKIVARYADNELVQVCGKKYGNSYCKNCNHCEENYYRAMAKKKEGK